jgi:serine/threonine protein kinase
MISNQSVAVKTILKSTINTPVARTRLQREIALLKKMEHPFIAEFFQVFETPEAHALVMEYVENGNLLDYVNSNGRLSEDQARRYFTQLLSVLEYLHYERKVAHRDLKCENVLLDRYNNIRIIDFGLSNMFSDINPKLSTACGSPAYAAPEMVRGNPYTQTADIWSAGILLFAICVGHLPFDDDNLQRLLHKIVYNEVFYPSFLSPPLIDLLQKMICKEPNNRISLEMIKNHPWFSQSEYLALQQSVFAGGLKWQTGEGESPEARIDKEIIDQMTALGVNCHDLHQALLVGEFTELTALYRIFLREKATEKMKDLMQKVSAMLLPMSKAKAIPLTRPPPRPPSEPSEAGQTRLTPLTRTPANVPVPLPFGGAGASRVLVAPVVAAAGGRRLSRPVAVRRPITSVGSDAQGSHETP